MPGCREAWTLWLHVQTQWRGGGLGLIGLDYSEARRMCRDLGIRWSYGLLRKLQALESATLKAMRDDKG